MNKLILFLAFSVLLLVPVVAQNAFAHQAVTTPSLCRPFVDPGGTAGHSVNAGVSGSSVSGSYPGVAGISVNAVRAVINLGGIGSGPFLVFTDTSSPYLYSFNNLAPGFYTVVACFMTSTTTIHTSSTTFTIAAPPPDSVITCGLNTFDSSGQCLPVADLAFCGAGTVHIGDFCLPVANGGFVCGDKTMEVAGICVPDLSQICQTGTFDQDMMCFATSTGQVIGGYLIDINSASLFVSAIGVNPVITGLVGITIAGITGQAVWFVHRRNKSENS